MFTGLIECTGKILSVDQSTQAMHFSVDGSGLADFDCKVGDSIAVNGCCLTVTNNDCATSKILNFDVSSETLQKTNLQFFRAQVLVNLERAMRLSDRLGGHLVSGHVDGVGRLSVMKHGEKESRLCVVISKELSKYSINKGSICLDGISLTINELIDREQESEIHLCIIPETLRKTHLHGLKVGHICNIEVDMVAKYILKR